jgi:nucleoid DNA-binding protein/cell division septation protein DedD
MFFNFASKLLPVQFGNYIHNLLLEHETVIIPGFGAFLSEYIPADINDTTGELKPPSKTVTFNPQIRNNDGLLVGYIAGQENISHFDALKLIEKERENIFYQLDKGEQVEWPKVGAMYYNKRNEIAFDPYVEDNLLLDAYGLETTQLETEVETENDPQPVIANTSEETVGSQDEDHDTKSSESDSNIPKESVSEMSPPPVHDKEPPEKKKRGWLWLLLVFIPLIAVSVFFILKGNFPLKPEKPVQITEDPVPEKIPVVPADTIKQDTTVTLDADSIQTNKTDTTKQSEVDTTITSETPKFYLVGGSFKSKENAETYLQELKDKGFNPEHLGNYGDFFIVGIGTYSTEEEAIIAKREYLEQSPGSGVWILER